MNGTRLSDKRLTTETKRVLIQSVAERERDACGKIAPPSLVSTPHRQLLLFFQAFFICVYFPYLLVVIVAHGATCCLIVFALLFKWTARSDDRTEKTSHKPTFSM